MQQLATRPCRLKLGATIVSEPKLKRLRSTDWRTTSAWRSSWLRMAVRMKSVLFE